MGTMASQIISLMIVYSTFIQAQIKETSKVRVTGLCAGNSPSTGEFPTQMARNAENVSIWWRHHETLLILCEWNAPICFVFLDNQNTMRSRVSGDLRRYDADVTSLCYGCPIPWSILPTPSEISNKTNWVILCSYPSTATVLQKLHPRNPFISEIQIHHHHHHHNHHNHHHTPFFLES